MSNQANVSMQEVIDAFNDPSTVANQTHMVKFIRVMRDRCIFHGMSNKQATVVAWAPEAIEFPYDINMDLAKSMLETIIDKQVELVKDTLIDPNDSDTLFEVLHGLMKECKLNFA